MESLPGFSRRRRKRQKLSPLTLVPFITAILLRFSCAQIMSSTSSPSAGTATITDSSTNTRTLSSLITSFTSASSTNANATATSRVTRDYAPPSGPFTPHAGSQNPNEERKEGVFNYYFLFLAVFGVLVAICLWWIHRRRKRRKEQMRLGGQHALARDLDGWVNTRRWVHGGWRHNQSGFVRREEGLDEHGEAPPPYEPKSETSVALGGANPSGESTVDISIPLRALQRDGIERSRPPEYQESLGRGGATSGRPSTANPHTTRLSTARLDTGLSRPNSSTRHLSRIEGIEP